MHNLLPNKKRNAQPKGKKKNLCPRKLPHPTPFKENNGSSLFMWWELTDTSSRSLPLHHLPHMYTMISGGHVTSGIYPRKLKAHVMGRSLPSPSAYVRPFIFIYTMTFGVTLGFYPRESKAFFDQNALRLYIVILIKPCYREGKRDIVERSRERQLCKYRLKISTPGSNELN